jgi:LytR cell envelope-related transcriptional attenuator
VQHAESISSQFPWRATTLVVGALAALELVALIAIGAVSLAPARHAVAASHKQQTLQHTAPVPHVAALPSVALRPRAHVKVLVLNGNGVAGAASSEAQHLQVAGYRIGGATNAQRHDYARSMVMYVPGWVKEARRLARDAGVRMVAPLDGLPRRQLKGSTIVLLLGT